MLWALLFTAVPLLSFADDSDDRAVERGCMESLTAFMHYATSIYCEAGVNSLGDSIGYFRANCAGESNEDGVRTNADIAMVTAFVASEVLQGRATLPADISIERLKQMAVRSLHYALSTHRANATAVCTDGKHWGSAPHAQQWESSLWAMSVAMAWHFACQWKGCSDHDREALARLLRSEALFLLGREVPTGFEGDTKAEENGWDSNLLATALAFGGTGISADSLQNALMRYSLNCYTVASDSLRVPELFAGANLYDDYTLQNHNYFHTSYQNVVMQELAESIVVMRLLAPSTYQSSPDNCLTWHWQEVWDNVLSWLALADGELAMPNGNDWSMFLYDQLPAYAAMTTMTHNADALMLERRCLEQLLCRQQTTADGSYMLNADIGPRRMGVTAHRVLTTLLMHRLFPTTSLKSSTWDDFCLRHRKGVYFESQQIVRGMTKSRFACFSASKGLHNCSAVIVPNTAGECKIAIPYKEGFGGNIIGTPASMPQITEMKAYDDGSWTVVGTADGEPFCIWATPGNAVMVIGRPVFLALADDPFTERAGRKMTVTEGKRWANISNSIGIVTAGQTSPTFRVEHKGIVNSINTCVISTSDTRAAAYFTGVSRKQTARLARHTTFTRQHNNCTLQIKDTDGTIRTLSLSRDKGRTSITTNQRR